MGEQTTPTPQTFSIIDRVTNRNLPTEDVPVYLDEQAAWRLRKVDALEAKTTDPGDLAELGAERTKLLERLRASEYTFHLRGVTSDEYDELVDEVNETMPAEMDEFVNPLTNQKVRTEKNEDERLELLNTLLLARSITGITAPDGERDENITTEVVAVLKGKLPVDGVRRVVKAAIDLRMMVEWMDSVTDEDF